ncbi:MAG: type II secretion system F family protein [Nitrospiraceae bacterium]|nr:type II secretion system F family protein [Nitrospiraceae bacterium]
MTPYLIVILFFLAIVLGLITLFAGYEAVKASPSFELKKRLKKLAATSDDRLPSELTVEILREMSPLEKVLYRLGILRYVDRLIEKAGLKTDLKIFLLIIIASALAGLGIGFYLGKQVIVAVILAAAGFVAPFIYLKMKGKARALKFTEQFPDALDMVARSLQAGHSLSSAVQMVGKEMNDPVATLFKSAYDEQSLGMTLKDALDHMLQRMKSPDLMLFVAAVNIHKDVGGNLSETLERLAQTIRQRLKIRRQVRVYSAQSRLSAVILVLLPIVMAAFFFFKVPGYVEELLTSDLGRYGIAFAVIAQLLGIIVIKKIIDIRI